MGSSHAVFITEVEESEVKSHSQRISRAHKRGAASPKIPATKHRLAIRDDLTNETANSPRAPTITRNIQTCQLDVPQTSAYRLRQHLVIIAVH